MLLDMINSYYISTGNQKQVWYNWIRKTQGASDEGIDY
jgi:hypothetical protein